MDFFYILHESLLKSAAFQKKLQPLLHKEANLERIYQALNRKNELSSSFREMCIQREHFTFSLPREPAR